MTKLQNSAFYLSLLKHLANLPICGSNITFHNYAIKSKCPYFIVVTLFRPTTCQVALAVLHALADKVGNVPQTIDW